MRTSMLVAVALLPVAALAAEGAAPVAPVPVSRVVLHPDAAVVARTAEARCGEGASVALFPNLPPALDPGTFRASIGAGGRVEGLAATEKVRRDAWSAELRDLEEQLEGLRRKDLDAQRRVERALATRQSAETLRGAAAPFIAREGALEPKPNTAAWAASMDTTRKAVEDAQAAVRAAETERRELARRIAELERRRDALSAAAPPRAWDVEVVVQCSGRAKVELSYLTTAARWSPAYEARADEAAGTVSLTVLADALQQTGEDWQDVSVALSTSLARRDARPPKPQRLLLRALEQEDRKKVLVARQEEVSHLESAEPAQAAAGAVEAADQGISVRLEVPGRSDLAGDGHAVRLPVETLKWNAQFGLVAVPKALPAVFRTATTTQAAKYPFPPGPVDLFNPAGFLGRAAMPRTAPGDKLELAFGLADSVKAKRVLLQEENKSTGLLGGGRRMLFAYRFELASYEKKPVTVALREHVPVSELDDVAVTIAKETTPGYEQAKEDGQLTWKVALAPGEKKSLELRFDVDIPSKYDSGGL